MSTELRGILERVLVHRHGQPEHTVEDGILKRSWGRGGTQVSVLYYHADWTRAPGSDFGMHRQVYGACRGGILVSGALKVAMMSSETWFGIYTICELGARPEITRANALAPAVAFFMDAGNVWFYGHTDGRLFVYDSETDELDDLGPIESALDDVIADWEASEAGQ